MPREVTERMLWLAPPVLFTLGTGISKPMFHEAWFVFDHAPLSLGVAVRF